MNIFMHIFTPHSLSCLRILPTDSDVKMGKISDPLIWQLDFNKRFVCNVEKLLRSETKAVLFYMPDLLHDLLSVSFFFPSDVKVKSSADL